MSTLVHERVTAPEAAIFQREFGYTLAWDLVTHHRPDGAATGRVVSLCPERALVVLDAPMVCRHAEQGSLVYPRSSGLPPALTHVSSRPEPTVSGDWVMELRLADRSLAAARRQLAWLNERLQTGEALAPDTTLAALERITDPERIERILRMLCHKRSQAVVIGSDDGRGRPCRAVLEPPGLLLVQWERGATTHPPLRVAVEGYDSTYEFIWPDASGFALSATEILRRRRRRARRATAPPRVQVAFCHPLEPSHRIVRPVHDLSQTGLSFSADPVEDVLYPGLRLELEVAWKGGPSWRVPALVRHCTAKAGIPAICGVEVQHTTQQQRGAWCREVEALLVPRAERGPDAESLWRLYEESGYFRLSGRAPRAFEPLRRAFASKVNRSKESEVLVHVGVRGPRGLEAAMSQVEAWSGSWLLFQVARRADQRPLLAAGDDVFRETYVRAFESVASMPGTRHLVAYIQDDARTPRWFQLTFGERLARSGHASITPFRALELRTRDLLRLPHASHRPASIDLARLEERTLAQSWFRMHRPAHYVAATGLEREHLELGAVEARWRGAGLKRTREVFAARVEGVVEALLVAEGADPGIHLFGLLDVARFVPLVRGARRHLRGLLQAAAQWHADAGRRRFVYFEEEPYGPLPDLGDVEDLGVAHTVVIPAAFLPEFLEHIYEITTPRAARLR
jgi:hypothetical protein